MEIHLKLLLHLHLKFVLLEKRLLLVLNTIDRWIFVCAFCVCSIVLPTKSPHFFLHHTVYFLTNHQNSPQKMQMQQQQQQYPKRNNIKSIMKMMEGSRFLLCTIVIIEIIMTIQPQHIVSSYVLSSSMPLLSPLFQSRQRTYNSIIKLQSSLNSNYDNDNNDDFKELLRVAQDPKLFEEYSLKKSKKKKVDSRSGTLPSSEINDQSLNNNNDNESNDNNDTTKKKNGYIPIEQWDQNRSKDDLSWEEKVQFDGQRFGNRFQQNEILRKNLKSW